MLKVPWGLYIIQGRERESRWLILTLSQVCWLKVLMWAQKNRNIEYNFREYRKWGKIDYSISPAESKKRQKRYIKQILVKQSEHSDSQSHSRHERFWPNGLDYTWKAREKVMMKWILWTPQTWSNRCIKNPIPRSKDRIFILFKDKKSSNKKWSSLQSFRYLTISRGQYSLTIISKKR